MAIWHVIADAPGGPKGRVLGPMFDEPCALGKNGMIADAEGREGDGKTPTGTYPFRRVYYRPDREETPICSLPVDPLSADYGWCDAPDSAHYNKLVRLPFGESHEKMWRDDQLYDLVLVIGHNDAPVLPDRGSCIFVHVARDGFKPTLGCVALQVDAMRRFLRMIKPEDLLRIG
jgi:L,D-peptidoglycan transpeptidase YkuD (ErfK/YbiS/YcfS/YnhG family)